MNRLTGRYPLVWEDASTRDEPVSEHWGAKTLLQDGSYFYCGVLHYVEEPSFEWYVLHEDPEADALFTLASGHAPDAETAKGICEQLLSVYKPWIGG